MKYENNLLFIEGIAALEGVDVVEYSDINYELIFNEKYGAKHTKLIAKGNKPNLTRQLFNGDMVIYDKCWFTTLKNAGLNIDDIPKGGYSLQLKIKTKQKTVITNLISKRVLNLDNNKIKINSDHKQTTIIIK